MEDLQTSPVIESVNKFKIGNSITACNFSRDGRRAIVGSVKGWISIWDLATGQLLKEKQMHTKKVTGIQSLNHSDSIITCGEDKKLYKWNLETFDIEQEFKGHELPINGVRCTLDDKKLFSYANDIVKVWFVENGSNIKELHFGTKGFALSADEKLIASGRQHHDEFTTWIVSVKSGSSIASTSRGSTSIDTVAFHGALTVVAYNGTQLDRDGELGFTLYNYATQGLQFCNKGGEISELSFSPIKDDYLLAASRDSTLSLWDIKTLELLTSLKFDSPVIFSKFSKDGNNILSYTEDGTLTYSKVTEVTLTHTASIKSKVTTGIPQVQTQEHRSSIKGNVNQTLLKPPSPRREGKHIDESQKREREKDVLQPTDEGKKRATAGKK